MKYINTNLCACGCGQQILGSDPNRKYKWGHSPKSHAKKCITEGCNNHVSGKSKYCKECLQKLTPKPRLCACGCGQLVTSTIRGVKFLPGHNATTKECKEKFKKTCLERYGTLNPIGNKNIQEKSKKTCLERYGVDNVFKVDFIKNRIKETCLERYGVDNPTKNKDIYKKVEDTIFEKYGVEGLKNKSIREKSKQTCLNRYGYEYSSQCIDTKKKIKETCLNHYGVSCSLRSKEVQEKSKQTCLEKYGKERACQSDLVKIKIKNTCIEKYGDTCVFKVDEFKKKAKNTLLEKYNVDNFSKTVLFKQLNSSKWKDISYNILLSNFRFKIEFTRDEFKGWIDFKNHELYHYIFRCNKCEKEYIADRHHLLCPWCYPHCGTSNMEVDFTRYLDSLSIKYKKKDRKILGDKRELDIYIPDYKLAIEIDGIWFHSTNFIEDASYHISKTELCNSVGIELIHIFEDEFIKHENIVKSYIKRYLNLCKIIDVNSCIIKNIDKQICDNFIKDNDIINSNENLCDCYIGLYNNDILYAIFSFKKINNDYIISHFTIKNDFNLRNLKIFFDFFIKKYKATSITIYRDRRWYPTTYLKDCGFKLIDYSDIRCWKIINNDRFVDNVAENDSLNIFDCGDLIFQWNAG